MGNVVQVANLPPDPSGSALRNCFMRIGAVTDVRPLSERDTRTMLVTMGTATDAKRAVQELDGMYFQGQNIRVTLQQERTSRDYDRPEPEAKAPSYEQRARITQQFRGLSNMTYELDCSGTPLVLRIFFPKALDATGEWRIEARTSHAADAMTADGKGASKLGALRAVAQSSQSDAAGGRLSSIDWDAVEQAMTSVRAL